MMRWTIHTGDALETLRGLEATSFDAVLCDPPYGLSFMGKAWDHGVPSAEVWAEVLRVLKPGAFCLAFGGTRTFHRLTCAIEDAGFEIRDMIAWVYGCLSEDTELLINGQWEPYYKAIDGSLALAYDVEHDIFRWEPIQNLYVYDYCDTAFRIVSDGTDQIVSRNHRCIIERDGRAVFEYAEALECKESVPVLEGLQSLLNDLPLPHEGTGYTEQVLFQEMHPEEYRKEETDFRAQGEDDCLCCLWERTVDAECLDKEGRQSDMLKAMQRGVARRRICETCPQGQVCMVGGKQFGISEKDEGRKQSGVEGRSDLLPQARELQADKICQMSTGVHGDGAEGRLYNGASPFCCSSHRQTTVADRNSSPQESRSSRQFSPKPGTLQEQQGPQAVRASRYTRTDLARVEPVHYIGKVWCIQVQSGAFVARRNGKVFVTGNSGFPKSLDISKAIDKANGAEGGKGAVAGKSGSKRNSMAGDFAGGEYHEYLPATDAARTWNGYGTALKPAWEPCIVAMKPLDGTFAQNAIKHGVAGLNIDAGRIETTDSLGGGMENGTSTVGEGWDRPWRSNPEAIERNKLATAAKIAHAQALGRWPANLILDAEAWAMLGDPARYFYCSKASRRERDAGLDGFEVGDRKTPMAGRGQGGLKCRACGKWKASGSPCVCPNPDFEPVLFDRPPQKNTHPCLKPLDLNRYLASLILPPKRDTPRRILVPFSGSGSEMIGALQAGWDEVVGIEREAEYVAIAEARLRHWTGAGAWEALKDAPSSAETGAATPALFAPEDLAS